MKNSEVFLSTFNKLDDHLREMDNSTNHVSFSSVVNRLKKSNRTIRHYSRKLFEYNELRNAIVHDRIDGTVIAEPNDFAVKEFNEIYDKIAHPKMVYDVCERGVETLRKKDSLSRALKIMKDNDYSQIPIYDGKNFVGMLNAEVITSWLANNSQNDVVTITDTNIGHVLEHRSEYRKTIFKSRHSSLHEILDIYKKNADEAVQIDAIVITHNGKRSEKPLGIITDFDIPEILEQF